MTIAKRIAIIFLFTTGILLAVQQCAYKPPSPERDLELEVWIRQKQNLDHWVKRIDKKGFAPLLIDWDMDSAEISNIFVKNQ